MDDKSVSVINFVCFHNDQCNLPRAGRCFLGGSK